MADWRSVKGTVKAINDKYGGALTFGEPGPDGKDIWWKFSKPEYREAAFHIPQKGEAVELIADIEGRWVKSIVPLNGIRPEAGSAVASQPAPFAGTEPQWEEPPLSAYGDIPERDVNADIPPKNAERESIHTSVCVQVAGSIVEARIKAGIFSTALTAEEIGAYIVAMAAAIKVAYSE